eukprot:5615671-Pyramimonas_sp.AAC.1
MRRKEDDEESVVTWDQRTSARQPTWLPTHHLGSGGRRSDSHPLPKGPPRPSCLGPRPVAEEATGPELREGAAR